MVHVADVSVSLPRDAVVAASNIVVKAGSSLIVSVI